ncbi:UNVERIFIED_CONTAM: hypothetical protein FKN15_025122 [Acipenser sinensis]
MHHLSAGEGHSMCKDDDDVDFYPFGKRSKIVRRFEPQDSPRPPAPPPTSKARVQYDDEFWERIHKQPRLKKDKWGGSSHLPPEESWPRGELERVQGCSGSTAPPRHRPAEREEEREGIPTANPFLPAFPVLPMQPFPLYPRDVPFYPSTQLDTNQQFPASQEEFCAAPGADPVSSYVMATADRQMAPEGFLTQPPHKEFWGFCFPSEE